MRTRRRPLAAILTALALGAAGCSNNTVSCEDVCSCLDKKGDATCIASCNAQEADAKKAASAARCDKTYLELTTCESDNSICDSATKKYTYPAGVCDPQVTAYEACASKATSSSSTSSSTGTGP